MHRGSSWALVAAGLVEHGHQVIAPDLPMDDDAAGAREWARVAIDAIERTRTDNVIVVGHSLAGLCVPVVATHHPVHRMVFVGGLLPVPGRRFVDRLAGYPDAISFPAGEDSGSGPFGLTWESVRDGFYHDCPEFLARQAFDELRGQSFTVFTERCPIECWPNVPSTYVLMRDDRAVGQSWARRQRPRPGGRNDDRNGWRSFAVLRASV